MSEAVELPDYPKSSEFEDFIAAQLLLSGFYLERSIEERGEANILEIDIITTNYTKEIPEYNLVEAKSGDWGVKDIFKVYGWMNYIGHERGQFIVSKENDGFDFVVNKAKEMNIDLIRIDSSKDKFDLVDVDDIESFEVAAFRYSFWIERELIKIIQQKKKEDRDKACYNIAKEYYHHLRGGIYFHETIAEKLYGLYDWYLKHPHLTASTSNEIKNGKYSDINGIHKEHFRTTFYQSEINVFQSTCLIEYLAKLQIIKYAVDFSLFEENGETGIADRVRTIIGDYEFRKSEELPKSFRNGIDFIRQVEDYKYFPVLWYYYIYALGGFILKDYKEEEFSYLSKRSGVSKDNVQLALDSIDVFFPIKNDWHYEDDKVSLLKMFPAPIRGVGSYLRHHLHLKEDEGTATLGSGDRKTINKLTDWHNCGYKLLKGDF
jgi:hypothetical protein